MYDPEGQVLAEYKRKEVSVAVLLAEDKECLLNAHVTSGVSTIGRGSW